MHTNDFHNMEKMTHSHHRPFPLLTVIIVLAISVFGFSILQKHLNTKEEERAWNEIKERASSRLIENEGTHFPASEEQKNEASSRLE